MIAWAIPAAFAGLTLLLGPLLVHMLLRRHARRVLFPTTRFLHATRAAAVQFRRPSDPGLLLLRMAIVAASVVAAAQPILLARWRTDRWNGRVARAVVLDTSAGMPSPAEASRLADQEQLKVFASAKFPSADLDEAIGRASAWLAHTPPARREIVVVSDFQRGAIRAHSLDAVPLEVGLRFIRAGMQPPTRAASLPIVSGWREADWQPAMTLNRRGLDARWIRRDLGEPARWLSTRQPQQDEEPARRAVAAAISFGVPIGDDAYRVVVTFKGVPATRNGVPLERPWMLRAALNLRQSELLRAAGVDVVTSDEGGALAVRTDVEAGSPAATAVLRAVIGAVRPVDVADAESEVVTLTDEELAQWRRDPAPAGRSHQQTPSDALESRWLWAIALGLIGIETRIRRAQATGVEQEPHVNAA